MSEMNQEYIIENAERVPFRDMSEEDQTAILKAKMEAPESVEIYGCFGEWIPASAVDLIFNDAYRVRAICTPLVIPWEIIHPQWNWAFMRNNEVVILARTEKDFVIGENCWKCNWAGCLDYNVGDILNIDTSGIIWDRSKTRRPV